MTQHIRLINVQTHARNEGFHEPQKVPDFKLLESKDIPKCIQILASDSVAICFVHDAQFQRSKQSLTKKYGFELLRFCQKIYDHNHVPYSRLSALTGLNRNNLGRLLDPKPGEGGQRMSIETFERLLPHIYPRELHVRVHHQPARKCQLCLSEFQWLGLRCPSTSE